MRFRIAGILTLAAFLLACSLLYPDEAPVSPQPTFEPSELLSLVVSLAESPEPASGELPGGDEWALWSQDTQLRGANTWQRIVIPELDGPEFLGSDYIGPPYTQADLNGLAASGANYINLSHPGLFTEHPPYVLDEQVQANLDHLLEMAAHADLFAVITFRTGPGRSDFTFYRDGAGDWFDPDLLVEWVWTDQPAQDAWVEMWRYTAERYRDNPVVIGYDLMCEPNAEDVVLGIYEPGEFYPQYTDTIYDWNRFYPRIVDGIREVDTTTPILVSSVGWGGVRWLPYLDPVSDSRVIYTIHQYDPHDYTHQEAEAGYVYPGELDLDWDGQPDMFDRAWLASYLSKVDEFKARYAVPVSVNEYGVQRWNPGAADFIRDSMDIFENLDLNYAVWVWDPNWQPWTSSVNFMNYRYGPDPANTTPIENDLQDVILDFWARNTVRPSNFYP